MAKGNNKKAGKESSTAATPRCNCDHPFTCICGNRPARPSKGHKWDPETQTWGGKGHKQKGASGQVASVGQQAQTTQVGQTKVAQWQRLPSQLLNEICQKEKRPAPKYQDHSKAGLFHFRVVVSDPKDRAKDLFFIPADAVANLEQAKEESAMLALLFLTPSLPHERKLPEPYRTTWLNAIGESPKKTNNNQNVIVKNTIGTADATSSAASSSNSNNYPDSHSNRSVASTTELSSISSSSANGGSSQLAAASSSIGLRMAKSYTSLAEQRAQQEEKRKQRNAQIRRHEAVRMANQNHPVFMSAAIRMQIESLLRGGGGTNNRDDMTVTMSEPDDDEVETQDEDEEDDIVKSYVQERLHSEGFKYRHVRLAYSEWLQSGNHQSLMSDEGQWDRVYEDCLQWLLVHLNEDELPGGFDPRGGTLDIIGAPSNKPEVLKRSNLNHDHHVIELASKYGLPVDEAARLNQLANREGVSFEERLYSTARQLAEQLTFNDFGGELSVSPHSNASSNTQIFQEELEALEAIFSTDFSVSKKADGFVSVVLPLDDMSLSLTIVLRDCEYPSRIPEQILVSGNWKCSEAGGTLLVELIRFLLKLHLGQPMLFELHGHCQSLLQSSNLSPLSLLPSVASTKKSPPPTHEQPSVVAVKERVKPQSKHRNRDRHPFWVTPPNETPEPASSTVSPFIQSVRRSLPAAAARHEFLEKLKQSRVVLVTGDTGCGKTTQIPAFILEEFPKEAKIVVAQPRRLAAMGVAARVAVERGEAEPGAGSVGYIVRGDSSVSSKNRLVFCTTGVLLRQLQQARALDCITHIVVDEVHERQLDTDVLLALLRSNLSTYPSLRVILMSATLDADRFAKYWGDSTPRMHIEGRTFPVQDFTLEDVLTLTGYTPPRNGKKGWKGSRITAAEPSENGEAKLEKETIDIVDADEITDVQTNDLVKERNPSGHGLSMDELLNRIEEKDVDFELISQLVEYLIRNKLVGDDGSILIFLSGAPEISKGIETIKRSTCGLPIVLLPLHGGLQPKEQSLVFRPARKGFTKVILSTNVAETSVTIPDCTIVIDSALEKQSSYDPVNRMPLLVEQFASRASLKQRRGRAGRVREGRCYKLISSVTLQRLKEHSEPEIKRCALDQTLLSLLFLGVENGTGNFMNTLLDPPLDESVLAAALSLCRLGAVKQTRSSRELSLTPLGMHLAGIPAPPVVGKMIVMGSILGCREASLAIASGLSVAKDAFLRIENQGRSRRSSDSDTGTMEDFTRDKIVRERATLFSNVGSSDHAMLAAVYRMWKSSDGSKKGVCDSLGVSFNVMREIDQTVRQLDGALVSIGFPATQESDRHAESWRIVRAVVVAAMAPNQLIKVVRPATTYYETAEGTLEKDGEAKELKFFVRTGERSGENTMREERVFIHPASSNFTTGSYGCPWLVYHSLIRTTKSFVRDVTECSAYPLLLFGGDLEVQPSKGVVVVDRWAKLSANARIAALVGGLREKFDEQLSKKVSDPSFAIADGKEMKLILKLILTDGLGT